MKTLFNQFTIIAVTLIVCAGSVSAQNAAYESSITQNLQSPVRVAIDHNDILYVTDAFQKAVIKYDLQGNYLETISVGGSPLSLAINSANQLFVGDGVNGKIYKIESNGTATEFYTGCVFPSSMTFSPDGLLYVADGKLKSVLVLNVSGVLVQTIGLGILVFPSEVVYDTRNSRILVSEHGGYGPGVGMSGLPVCKIWNFNLSGVIQGSFASAGNGNGQFYRIQGMTVGKCGNLYVCDPYQGNISVFNESNVFVTRFGQFGTLPGELNVPLDVLFDSQERVIITSMNNGELVVYNVADTLPTSNIVNSDATICSNQTTNITIDFTGTAPWTFTYTIDGLNPVSVTTNNNPYVLNVNTGGVYEIVALNDLYKTGTCFSGSAKVTVNSSIPTTNISTGNAVVCLGSSINIPIQFTGTSPWTFTYTKDSINPTTILTANNPYIISTSDAGFYEVTAVSAGGCIGNTFVGNANISMDSLPTASFVSGMPAVSVCQGESVILPVQFTGNSPWDFAYTIDGQNEIHYTSVSNTFDIVANQSGLYNISTITDANCTNIVSQQAQEVIVKPIPSSVMASVNTTICSDASAQIPIEFTGNAPFNFTYSINGTILNSVSTNDYQYNLSVVDAGIYQITELSGDGCSSQNNTGSAEITVTPVAIPQFSFVNNSLEVTFTNNSTNALSYAWDFGDGQTSTEINPIHQYVAPSVYNVVLTVSNGFCPDGTMSQTLDLSMLNVNNNNLDNNLLVFPNPTKGYITVSYSNTSQNAWTLEVINSIGQVVFSEIYNKNKENIDLSKFASGMYTVKVVSDGISKTEKLILNK